MVPKCPYLDFPNRVSVKRIQRLSRLQIEITRFLKDEPTAIRTSTTQLTVLFPTVSTGRKAIFLGSNDTYRRFNIFQAKRSPPGIKDNRKS